MLLQRHGRGDVDEVEETSTPPRRSLDFIDVPSTSSTSLDLVDVVVTMSLQERRLRRGKEALGQRKEVAPGLYLSLGCPVLNPKSGPGRLEDSVRDVASQAQDAKPFWLLQDRVELSQHCHRSDPLQGRTSRGPEVGSNRPEGRLQNLSAESQGLMNGRRTDAKGTMNEQTAKSMVFLSVVDSSVVHRSFWKLSAGFQKFHGRFWKLCRDFREVSARSRKISWSFGNSCKVSGSLWKPSRSFLSASRFGRAAVGARSTEVTRRDSTPRIEDVSHLAELTGLDFLDISGCIGVKTLAPLKKLIQADDVEIRMWD